MLCMMCLHTVRKHRHAHPGSSPRAILFFFVVVFFFFFFPSIYSFLGPGGSRRLSPGLSVLQVSLVSQTRSVVTTSIIFLVFTLPLEPWLRRILDPSIPALQDAPPPLGQVITSLLTSFLWQSFQLRPC